MRRRGHVRLVARRVGDVRGEPGAVVLHVVVRALGLDEGRGPRLVVAGALGRLDVHVPVLGEAVREVGAHVRRQRVAAI